MLLIQRACQSVLANTIQIVDKSSIVVCLQFVIQHIFEHNLDSVLVQLSQSFRLNQNRHTIEERNQLLKVNSLHGDKIEGLLQKYFLENNRQINFHFYNLLFAVYIKIIESVISSVDDLDRSVRELIERGVQAEGRGVDWRQSISQTLAELSLVRSKY